MVSHYLRVD